MRLVALALLASVFASGALAQNNLHSQATVALPVATSDELFVWNPAATPPAGQFKATVQQLYNIIGVTGDCTGASGPVVSITCSIPATGIASGTLAAARLPTPTASTIGGVQSVAAVANNWISSISTSGVPTLSQPSIASLSDGSAAMAGSDVGNAMRNGVAPSSVTACGTGPSVQAGSTDYSGTITVGSGTVTACTVNFAVTHSPALRCWITPSAAIAVGRTATTTALTALFASSLGAGSFDYGCN
jgi:hypothetical protein